MIRSFHDQRTEKIFRRERIRTISSQIQRVALRRLLILDAAESMGDLKIPPGNRLEKLKGDRKGQFSIRVNKQWRICFKWTQGVADNVEFTDYH